ncbi:glycosyltransferase family 2 protein [Lutibacter sp. HS1-25]|uniref:glycosyltransferase family 2 protein n=1 Tax=Lutibacter sp. HS1-25 TaxID=2485000 RepID=UPI0010100FC1|nr:glycosyltransferase family 2 protein [Lutibacter sp. HS1-25]RXP45404.1 glycosyltransferase family 2 protein [Lutibacter sp. HS1-25]
MKVSVIIPNFNNAIYLNACINSVINQGSDVIKEIIVVDDHSTDNSWEILLAFELNYPNIIKIFKNPKKGVQSARNFGFLQSTGQYIQWLDSDDILGTNKIKNQLEILSINKSYDVMSFCGWVHFNDDINTVVPKPNKCWKNYEKPLEWLIDSWNGGGMMQTACWLTPRELCKDIYWDETLLKNQDGIYFFEIILKSKTLFFCNEAIVFYRQPQSTNISKQKSKLVLKSLFASYKYYEKILEVSDTPIIRKALATNYANLIAYIYPNYKDLHFDAKKQIELLGLKKIPSFGGKKFCILRFFLGIYPALKLSNKINNKR